MLFRRKLPTLLFLIFALMGCAPIGSSAIVVSASQAIAEAEVAGASCTQEQLDGLSPITQDILPASGQELLSSEKGSLDLTSGQPMCDAPYEYYSALEYIYKAREEMGFSDYQAAIKYARKSRAFAIKAQEIAFRRNRERGR